MLKPGAREHAFPNRGGLTDCFHEKVEITATVLPLFGVQRIMALLNRGSTVSYYHLDGNGSVRALSNSSKTITDTYSYNAFGELISSSGSTVNPFRWLGGAGIYDDGARGSVFGLLTGRHSTYAPVLARQTGNPYLDQWGKQFERDIVHQLDKLAGTVHDVLEWLFDSPVVKIITNLIKGKPIWGEFCGPQTEVNFGTEAKDLIDGCCKGHDQDWANKGCTAANQWSYLGCRGLTLKLCACAAEKMCWSPGCAQMKAIIAAYCLTIVNLTVPIIGMWPPKEKPKPKPRR